MAWHETARAQAAKVRRTWYCDACEHKWVVVTDADDPTIPSCPMCLDEPVQHFEPFGVKTNASRAVEFAHKMAERDFGVTDLNDHLKKGDIAHKAPPPIQNAEAEAITQAILDAGGVPDRQRVAEHLKPLVKGFFGANGAAAGPQQGPIKQAIDNAVATAPVAAAMARQEGSDPVALLHEAGKQGLDPTSKKNLTVVGRSMGR